MNLRLCLSCAFACLLLGCEQFPELTDEGQVCVSADLVDGEHRLFVEANSGDCAADHKGASFECSVSVEGLSASIGTVFQDGKDPNDACAGPLETTCEVAVDPGTYAVEFAGEQYPLLVPGGTRVCFPGGGGGTDDAVPQEEEGGW